MKFSKGDQVAHKKTGEEGIVVNILDDQMLEINFNDTVIPVFSDDLEYPYLNWFLNDRKKRNDTKIKKYHVPKEKDIKIKKMDMGIYLSFWVDYLWDGFEDLISDIKIQLNNETGEDLFFMYSFKSDNASAWDLKSELKSFENVYLHSLTLDGLNDKPKFSLSIGNVKDKELIAVPLTLKPKKLFEELVQLGVENKPAYFHLITKSIDLFVHEHHKSLKKKNISSSFTNLKKPVSNFSSSTRNVETELTEIDLHADKLSIDWTGKSKSDILPMQLAELEIALNQAIRLHQKSLIVIHGIGEGILKKNIFDILNSYKEVSHFENDYHPKYGYGSTTIYFR